MSGAMIVSAGPTLIPEFLPAELHRSVDAEPEAESEVSPIPDVDWRSLSDFVETAVAQGKKDVYRRALEHFDRLVISSVVRQTGGQQNRAAEILGDSRVTLRSKLRCMQLAVEKVLTRQETEEPKE